MISDSHLSRPTDGMPKASVILGALKGNLLLVASDLRWVKISKADWWGEYSRVINFLTLSGASNIEYMVAEPS